MFYIPLLILQRLTICSFHQISRSPMANPSEPIMSASAKNLLSKVRSIVPPMLEKFHKGKYRSFSIFLRIFDLSLCHTLIFPFFLSRRGLFKTGHWASCYHIEELGHSFIHTRRQVDWLIPLYMLEYVLNMLLDTGQLGRVAVIGGSAE